MKFLNKLLFIALVIGFGTACENTNLDLLDDPNGVKPENAGADFLFNSIQLSFSAVYNYGDEIPGGVARMYNANNGFTYVAYATPQAFSLNEIWGAAYEDILPDVDALITIANASGLDVHAGAAKVMEAYTMMVLVDLFGQVPYSQATQGLDAVSPTADSGSDVYDAALALLDDAITQLGAAKDSSPRPTSDIFYGGASNAVAQAEGWTKFANTLKIRAALNRRLIDPSGSAATINSVLADGNFISSGAEDFQFQFLNNRLNPQSRHPFYADATVSNDANIRQNYGPTDRGHYESNDGDYISNYYMWLLRADKETADGVTIIDPRIRYYFYRKISAAEAQDPTSYSCHFSALPDQSAQPQHYADVDPDLPYCIVLPGDGYSGRDHLNGEGIPPDGPTRTSYGLYPGGGDFDAGFFEDTRQQGSSGGNGAGISPIMLSSFVNFMRAEAALTLGTSDDARAQLQAGIEASMAKVRSFESLVPGTMGREIVDRQDPTNTKPVSEVFAMTDEDVANYVTEVLRMYDEADDAGKLDVIIKEYYIAAWGNGIEAYNMYRRTGYPANMQPAIEPQPGAFPSSMPLPTDHVTRNSNTPDRSITDRVFWDDGSADVY